MYRFTDNTVHSDAHKLLATVTNVLLPEFLATTILYFNISDHCDRVNTMLLLKGGLNRRHITLLTPHPPPAPRCWEAGSAKAQPPPPATEGSPAARIRQSPRLQRKRRSGALDEDGVADRARVNGEAGSKRPPPPPPPGSSAAVAPAPKRRQVENPNGGVRKPRAAASVFVGETPQKESGGGGGDGGSTQTRRRRGRSGRTPQDEDPESKHAPPAGALATTKASQVLPGGGHVPGSPAMSMVGSPSTGRTGRRRAAMGPVSPENLFVAESPGGSFGSRSGRRAWVTGDLAGVGGGIGRHLMTEGASPARPRRATVPDTPA